MYRTLLAYSPCCQLLLASPLIWPGGEDTVGVGVETHRL